MYRPILGNTWKKIVGGWSVCAILPNPFHIRRNTVATVTAYTDRCALVEDRGIEPRISACKADVFPLALVPQKMAPPGGVEPKPPAGLEGLRLVPLEGAKIVDRLGGIEPSTHLSIALPVSYKAVKINLAWARYSFTHYTSLGIEPS